MSRPVKMLLLVPLVLAACPPVLVAGDDKGFAAEGKVSIGLHKVPLTAGALYAIRVEAKDFQPNVQVQPGYLPYAATDFRNPHLFQGHFSPVETTEYKFFILPNTFGLKGDGPFSYSIEVKPIPLAPRPVIEVAGKWTADDPKYQPRRDTPFKAHEIKLEKGKYYVIDLLSKQPRAIDTYLYLEDAKKEVVASDDDGGEDLNARIVYQAPEDGTYRIIATPFRANDMGEYLLRVRAGQPK